MGASSPLHQLAEDHFLGRLDRSAYLAARRRLLDAAAGGGTGNDGLTAPRPRVETTAPNDDTRPHPIPMRPTVTEAPRGRGVGLPAAVGAVLLIVVGAGWWLLGSNDEVPPGDAPPSPTVAKPDNALLQELLAAPDWQGGLLDRFEQQWLALQASQRQALHKDGQFQRLQRRLDQRISEYRALVEVDDSPANREWLERLLDFEKFLMED